MGGILESIWVFQEVIPGFELPYRDLVANRSESGMCVRSSG